MNARFIPSLMHSGLMVPAMVLSCLLVSGSASAATIDLVPVACSGDCMINGNEVILSTVPQDIEVEVRISGFAPEMVAAYQSTIDCTSLDSNVSGKLLISNLDGTIDACSFGTGVCSGIDDSNPRYLLDNAASTLPACSLVNNCPSGDPGEFACGSVAIFGDSGPDDGMPYYGSTWGVSVTADFKGTANLTVQNDPNNTFMKNPMARDIMIDAINPAIISVPVGRCCGTQGSLGCTDEVTEGECNSLGGAFAPGAVCSGQDVNPADGLDDACPCCFIDSDCDDGNACTIDICDPSVCCVYQDITPADQCCNPANGSLTAVDDGDDCTDDVCNSDGTVSHDPSATGTSCDDGNGCTFADQCDGVGNCAGVDTNTAACTTIDDCPAGSQACEDGFCVCALETKLDLAITDSGNADVNCFEADAPVTVEVVMGAGSECVTGGQFLVLYDPSCLEFVGWQPGEFFSVMLHDEIDTANGEIFGAVGILPGTQCTQGPESLATLSFQKLGTCGACGLSFGDDNPRNTILVNDEGNSVPLALNASKQIRLSGDITLNSPEGIMAINPDCDSAIATVTWEPLTVDDSCEGPGAVTLDCDVTSSSGIDLSHLAESGGVFPQGDHTFVCTATNECGVSVTRTWNVQVSDEHALKVDVQLQPTIVGSPIARCICFDFFSDCVQAPTQWCETLTFGGPFNFVGKSSGEFKVPKGQYACVTAKDPLHTLRSVSEIDCVGNSLMAEFKGDPTFEGNWLVGGNLDCWKADGNGDTVDILDFGMFVSQYLSDLDPNTPCGSGGPHSDMNGDGVVDSADFVYVSQNFLDASKNACCEDGTTAAAEEPVVTITVKEILRRDLDDIIVADLNNDYVIDAEDMAIFMSGELPQRSIKRRATLGNRYNRRR